jgi:hypothetical protein
VNRHGYLIASMKPFWRWAVAPQNRPDIPGIPFYRKAGALAFYDSVRADLPDSPPVLLRRRWGRGVEVTQP